MALKPDEYTVSSGFTWYANAEYTNDAYLIISDTYSQGWSTQAESKPTIWRSETGTTESFVSLVNQLPDVNGVTGFTDSGVAMNYLQSTGKYFVSKDEYLGIVTDGLILNLDAGWYPSYSGSGTTWKDLKGTNNVTLVNGTTYSNGDIVFDGTDDFVGTTSSVTLSRTNITMEVWLYMEGKTSTQRIMYNGNSGASGYGIYFINQQLCILYGGVVIFAYTSIPYNTWCHAVFTRDSTTGKLYVNTNQTAQTSSSSPRVPGTQFGYYVTLGGAGNGGETLDGSISQARIYNKTLSPQEILQNYNATKGRFGL